MNEDTAGNSDRLRFVFEYHQAIKHQFQVYARGPGYLDWATQPDPFRRYSGARLIALATIEPGDGPRYDDIFNPALWNTLCGGFPAHTFFIGLASIPNIPPRPGRWIRDRCRCLGMIAEYTQTLEGYGAWFYPRLYWEAGMIGQLLYLEAEAAGIRSTGIGCFFDDPMHEVLGLEDRSFQGIYHFTVGGPVKDTRLTTLPAYAEE